MTILAIDIGGSGSRIVAADGDSRRADGPAPVLGAAGHEHAEVIRALAGVLGAVTGTVDTVAVSATGLISRGHRDDLVSVIRGFWAPRRVIALSDAVAAVVAAWDLRGGGVVAAGTGVIGFGTDLLGTWRRSDGWGNLVGDEGSAAWIGQRGLIAAFRAHDGRPGGSEPLLRAAQVRFGIIDDLPHYLRAARNSAGELASFAPDVTAAAHGGDDVAADVVRRAAAHLADTGLSVLAGSVPPRLALIGGIASDPLLSSDFLAHVRARRPDVEARISSESPLDGALALARESAEGTDRSSHPPYLTIHDQGAS
ncbi:BadF/BadG/BcrA/BcrD ATPase family protein [soil metagenome]